MSQIKNPLRYNITDWHQLTQCLSNYSNTLYIKVKDVDDSDRLKGTIISVEDSTLGPVYTYVVEGVGNLEGPRTDGTSQDTVSRILNELSRFGYFITFNHRAYLSEDQINYLITLQGLHYDKIRLLDVHGIAGSKTHVVAFNVSENPYWLLNEYAAPESEFLEALNNGSAINLDEISETQNYRWYWLDYVGDIQDIIDDNERYEPEVWEFYTKQEIDDQIEDVEASIPVKLSQLDNDTGFITVAVTNLLYYYTKSETYSKQEVNDIVATIQSISFRLVDELPETGRPGVIYLVPSSDPQLSDVDDEYIWIDNHWEKIGSTQVDLTGYATEDWVELQIQDFLTEEQITLLVGNLLDSYYTKTETDNLLANKVTAVEGKGLSSNDFTDDDVTKLAGLHNYDDTELRNSTPRIWEGEEDVQDHTFSSALKTGDFYYRYDVAGNDKVYREAYYCEKMTDVWIVWKPVSTAVDSALSDSSTNPVQNRIITQALSLKVDKVEGKGLSTNDFTDADKTKLAGLENYDDTEIRGLISERAKTFINTKPGSVSTIPELYDGIQQKDIILWGEEYPVPDGTFFLLKKIYVVTNIIGALILQEIPLITVDSALSDSSTNPVENRIIAQALGLKVDKEQGKGLSSNDFTNAYKELLDFRITKQPDDIVGTINGGKDISITAIGTNLTYQWQFSNDNGATWTNSSATGYNTNTLSIVIGNLDYNGRLYRCKVTDGNGTVIYSDTCQCIVYGTKATTAQIKSGSEQVKTIVPNNIDAGAFYGLAKASGDSTQASSQNPVGTYTATAMEKIREMLGIVVIEESDYESLVTPDENTIYLITEDSV